MFGSTEIVRDDPTNNVPDTIFSKLGMQLHSRDHHPIGILKNAIYDYFDTNYPKKFDKFDNLFPVVSVKQVCTCYNFSSKSSCSCYNVFFCLNISMFALNCLCISWLLLLLYKINLLLVLPVMMSVEAQKNV